MALPILPVIAIASTVVGAGISAIGAIQQGNAQAAAARAQSQAASYSAQVGQNNAIVAQQNAQAAARAGEAKAEAASLQGRAQEGRILAAQAASGLDVDSGSSVDVRATQRGMNRLAIDTEANNAALQVYGYRAQGTNYTAQAELDTMKSQAANAQAQSATKAGGLSAAGSIIGGLGGAFNRFSWMTNNADPIGAVP